MKTNKKGISLIVLIITIVVMIILAAAVILYLEDDKIIDNAKKAVTENDMAAAREVVSVARAEWRTNKEKIKEDGYETFVDYAKYRLEKAGVNYEYATITEGGQIYFDVTAGTITDLVKQVPVGANVEGYKLNNTTTYNTTGKENTYSSDSGSSVTITRDNDITWKYMGIDENGEAIIVGSVADSSPKMTLGGKGGYLNGPQELNDACKALYSSEMGTARNINIDDVTRVLEYTGERGSYSKQTASGCEVFNISEPKTINEIAKEIGYDMNNFQDQTPEDGKDIGTYKSDDYIIYKDIDASQVTSNTDIVNLIYPGSTASENPTLTTVYWLSSTSVRASFLCFDRASFAVRYVWSNCMTCRVVFDSEGDPNYYKCAIRPVVTLKSTVQAEYSKDTNTLRLK